MTGICVRARFELRRAIDGLVYVFDRTEDPNGRAAYKRSDGDYWIVRLPDLGWVSWDFESQSCMGRPWDVLPGQQSDEPPEGTWISRKAEKSYVYELVYVDA
jgi:hypothetical protein